MYPFLDIILVWSGNGNTHINYIQVINLTFVRKVSQNRYYENGSWLFIYVLIVQSIFNLQEKKLFNLNSSLWLLKT